MTDAPRTPATVRTVDAGAVALAVTEYAGPPGAATLVLLHGIGSRSASWWPVIDDLAATFRLLVPDLRGHGASGKPESGYGLPDFATDLQGLLDAYGLARPLLLGHSLGGVICLEWAKAHPATAASIVIEDSPLRDGPKLLPAFDGWIALNRMTPAQAAAYYARENPDWTPEDCARRAESITSVAPGVFTELRAINDLPEARDRIGELAGIASPVLFVHGDIEAGGMVVAEDAARLAATLPDVTVVRIPGGSHSLHRDFAGPFLAAVGAFLSAQQ